MSEPRERAWNDIHDLLPEWWQVGPATFDPGQHRWSVTARSPKYSGRLRPPATISADGEDETAALTYLARRLRLLRDVERRMALEEKARAAFLHGAEEHSRSTLGRPLTQEELERVLARYRYGSSHGRRRHRHWGSNGGLPQVRLWSLTVPPAKDEKASVVSQNGGQDPRGAMAAREACVRLTGRLARSGDKGGRPEGRPCPPFDRTRADAKMPLSTLGGEHR